ncbi:MAG: trypsin-like peptidase domain-containing protein [Caldilineaceae bacterium]
MRTRAPAHRRTRRANAQEGDDIIFGSGVIISGDGAILTALHVVEYADEILVTFADGTEAKAQIAAVMPDNDIAVLLPDTLPETFAPATLGNPGTLRVGDEAFVVGNPLGLTGSIDTGVISGFDRRYRLANQDAYLERLIQFDAAVNIGSSGGPLLNRNGEVVGIVVGLVNPTAQEAFSGIGFAVRIDQAVAAAGAPEPIEKGAHGDRTELRHQETHGAGALRGQEDHRGAGHFAGTADGGAVGPGPFWWKACPGWPRPWP